MVKLLIADDEQKICRLLESFFSQRGYDVLLAHDGPSALARIREDRPHLVFLDLHMPGLNGLDILTEARQVDETIKIIIEECQRAADITRLILRFAKRAPADLAPVDVKAIVEESLTLAGYQVRLERVERTVRIPQELPKVRGNQNQLQEVILNLILNACQAMGDAGGKLELRAESLNGSFVQLQVADTGPGIPASKLTKIFDPFYTTKPTGTGLGLFVSQRIVKSHGGTMAVDSAEGHGACFTIRLPVWQDAPAAVAGVGR